MKILNLYAGIGGNRKLWGNDHDITAVELDPKIAEIYHNFFPDDNLIIGDAHEFLLNHYKEFDFIWSSPPCPTHSRARYWGWSSKKPVYPDLKLWQEIIFLQYHCISKFAIENVVPYYNPFIKESIKIGRHLFWSNFSLNRKNHTSSDIRKLSGTSEKDKMIRNAVDSEIGLHILNCAIDSNYKEPSEQGVLF